MLHKFKTKHREISQNIKTSISNIYTHKFDHSLIQDRNYNNISP